MKLYTKTVCPKCIVVKRALAEKGILDEVKVINVDTDEDARDLLLDKGFMGVPILEHEGEFYTTVPAIQELIQSL